MSDTYGHDSADDYEDDSGLHQGMPKCQSACARIVITNALTAAQQEAADLRDERDAALLAQLQLDRTNATLQARVERMEGVVEAARHVAIHGGVHEMGDFEGTDFGTAHGSLCDALASLDSGA